VTSERKIEANRRNAARSTGPRTAAGKTRAAQNARRHGLNVPVCSDPAWSGEIKGLARSIAGEDAPPRRYELACRVAEAQIDVIRVRRARLALWPAALGEVDGIKRLAAMDFYERLAVSHRKFAMRHFDERAVPHSVETNPTDEPVETNPTRKSVDTNPAGKAVKTNPTGERVETKPTGEAADTEPTGAFVETNPIGIACGNESNR
jgi:hypothetical protein